MPSPDEQMRAKLVGVWVGVHKYASSSDSTVTFEISADGTWADKIKVGSRTIEQAGTWDIQDSVLVQTVTRDSQNARVPSTSRLKIVHVDGRELELDFEEKGQGAVYPTNRVIFKRQTN